MRGRHARGKLLLALALPATSFVALTAGPAAAQDASKAAAIAAFDEAQALMDQGQVAAACPKFAQSYELDPQLGALLYLADCLEQNGQTASAWSGFRDAAEVAQKRGDARAQVASERAEALEPRLSRMQLEVPADLPGLRITRNGVPVPEALWVTAIPVDPGEYVIEASAAGYVPWQGKVEIRGEGSVTTLAIPPLEPEAVSADPSPAPAPRTEQQNLLAEKWPALAAGGVGLAGAVVWTVFGLKSMDAKARADELCDGTRCSTSEGVALREDALDAGTVATVGMVITGVGLASAAVLWFTLPFGSEETPPSVAGPSVPHRPVQVGIGPGQVQLVGTW